MRVNPRDGACRSCSGVLRVIDADDATMTVEPFRRPTRILAQNEHHGCRCPRHISPFLKNSRVSTSCAPWCRARQFLRGSSRRRVQHEVLGHVVCSNFVVENEICDRLTV